MTKQLTQRVVAVLLVLFLLVYVGYQVRQFLYNPISTDTVYEYTVSRSLTTTGIAVRDETVLDKNATGLEYYPLDDASRVAIGETVAETFQGRSGDKNATRVRLLEEELQMLREAEATPADYSNTEVFNRDIKSKLSELSAMSSEGRYADLDSVRQNLTSNINKKQISNGKARNFSLRIGQLQTEITRLSGSVSASVTSGSAVTAPVAGYFSKQVDGFESWSKNGLADMKVDDLLALIEGDPPRSTVNKVGKMVHSEKWTFVAPVPSHNTEWIKEGRTVEIEFDQVGGPVPATITDVITQKNSETAILLLSCNMMNEELINLRTAGATINFERYTGIRINTTDLRFRTAADGTIERGVYILRNSKVYFRLVDPVYEETNFVLSKTYYTAEEYLEPQRQLRRQQESATPEPEVEDLSVEEEQAIEDAGETVAEDYKRYVILFDQVITKGFDLHDGKVLQDY